MNIKFLDISLINFLSYHNTHLEFEPGFTLVSGINNYKDDCAESNGSGKSGIFEAIIWVITGETSRGIKDIRNNKYLDEGALVELNFILDNNTYKLIRSKEHKEYKTNLKIYINNEDKSGKSLKDSEKLLIEYLPDLNYRLISSIIILGQGLPNKFSANTPSGRKEVLEKLTNTDFMIEDLKARISKRYDTLKEEETLLKTQKITNETKLEIYEKQLKETESQLDILIKNNCVECLNELQQQLDQYTLKLNKLNDESLHIKTIVDGFKNKKHELEIQKVSIKNEVVAKFNKFINDANCTISNNKIIISNLEEKLKTFLNIKDTCPTCGQKLLNVELHSQDEILAIKKQIKDLNKQIELNTDKITGIKNTANSEYIHESTKYSEEIHELDTKIVENTTVLTTLDTELNNVKDIISKLNSDIIKYNLLLSNEKQLIKTKNDLNTSINLIYNDIMYINNKFNIIENKLDIIQKFTSIVTRDFRGYLLINIIDYINKKAKEYCIELFETDKISFELNGNNIDIIYDNKQYLALSGGEKQRVDIIIQLSIRDMLCEYTGFSSNILVLDEIIDNLDNYTSTRMFNMILNKLNDIECVYIISHHAKTLDIPNDNELIIVKNEDGVSSIS